MSQYTGAYTPIKDVPVVSAATEYTARDEQEYILVFNQALWISDLGHLLVNPS